MSSTTTKHLNTYKKFYINNKKHTSLQCSTEWNLYHNYLELGLGLWLGLELGLGLVFSRYCSLSREQMVLSSVPWKRSDQIKNIKAT